MSLPEYFEAIENHLDQFVDSDDEILVFDEKDSPDFHLDVYLIKPNNNRNFYILMTNGVSSQPMTVPSPEFNPFIELAMLLPKNWDFSGENWKLDKNYWPIRLLKDLGRFPHQNNTWLGFGHTVEGTQNGKIEPTNFSSSILLKSFSLPQEFQKIPFKDKFIDLFIIFPLYKEELEYKKTNWTNFLLENFQEKQISDIIILDRDSACD